MVKKSKKASPRPKANKTNITPPESWTGYPAKKKCDCPVTALSKAAGGGKSAS